MRYFLLTLVIPVLLVLPATAQAARFTGAYLLHLCEMDAQGREIIPGGHTACQAYISGVIDYHMVLQSMKLAPKIDICIPDTVTTSQLHSLVLADLRKHGEGDAFVAAPAVTMALYNAFPCR